MGSKMKTTEFEHPDEERSRRFGWFATLAVLTIVGVAVWLLIMSSQEAG